MPLLTLKEEIILSAIMMHGGSSRGAPIRKKVIELGQKDIVYGTLYNLMEKLIGKGYVVTGKSDPIPVQGGRSKTIYGITPEGKKVLQETLEMHAAIRQALPELG
ncbi:helix-turn-helix transcriptional regulator [bacterium]|nr:helix-turn-helix transcriptional regulator [bacterium]